MLTTTTMMMIMMTLTMLMIMMMMMIMTIMMLLMMKMTIMMMILFVLAPWQQVAMRAVTWIVVVCLVPPPGILSRAVPPWAARMMDCGFSPWTQWLGCGGFGTSERYRLRYSISPYSKTYVLHGNSQLYCIPVVLRQCMFCREITRMPSGGGHKCPEKYSLREVKNCTGEIREF